MTRTAPKTPTVRRQGTFGWGQVRGWRVLRHHLTERAPAGDALQVVSDIAGLHAQLASSAELSLHARVDGLARDHVRTALADERSLVKTWAMRGTLHLLPAREFATWQAAQRTRDHFRKPVWYRNFGVTAEELDQLVAAVASALDGRTCTREELATAVGEITGVPHLADKVRESWGALLKPAAFQGALAFGPADGQRARFVRPDQWLAQPDLDAHDPEASRLEVVRRFLSSAGPVTREELARWWGMTPAEAGRCLRAMGGEAAQVDVDGTACWMLSEQVGALAKLPVRGPRAGTVRLLPAFDPYVVTLTRQAEHFLPPAPAGSAADAAQTAALRARIYRQQGWLSPVVAVDGRMDGVWRHEVRGRRVDVSVEPFAPLPAKTRRGVEREASRLANFLDKDLRLTWSDADEARTPH